LDQASSIKDIKEWTDPLAAIVLWSFDLAYVSPGSPAEENFYYKLNKVRTSAIRPKLMDLFAGSRQ
jgi:hypothetical protein